MEYGVVGMEGLHGHTQSKNGTEENCDQTWYHCISVLNKLSLHEFHCYVSNLEFRLNVPLQQTEF